MGTIDGGGVHSCIVVGQPSTTIMVHPYLYEDYDRDSGVVVAYSFFHFTFALLAMYLKLSCCKL